MITVPPQLDSFRLTNNCKFNLFLMTSHFLRASMLTIAGFFFLCNVLAQNAPKLQNLTPPPPDVSALGKFGLIPVSNFSGIPNINYPVYNIREGNISLPISLMYHAGGLKVKEDASEVGLGWALSAGGSIISSVRGQPDFPGGFYSRHSEVPDEPEKNLPGKSPIYSFNDRYYIWGNDEFSFGSVRSGLTLSHSGSNKQYMPMFEVGQIGSAPDFASDLYIISMGGKSYKFVFDNDFKPVVLGDGTLKIELINFSGLYPDWKVTDEQGIVYYFTQRQISSTNSSDPYYVNNRVSLSINTWHLTKVVSPVNGEINLDYLYSTQTYVHPLPSVSHTNLIGNTSPNTQQSPFLWSTSYSVFQQLNLSRIRFSEGFVQFVYSDERLDLEGARRLQKIEVRDGTGALIRKVELDNNHYFMANGVGSIPVSIGHYSNDNHTKRLKLNGITESDSLGTVKFKKTSYGYNEQVNLPSKLSMAIDHWGYYNGIEGDLLPPVSTFTLGTNGANISYHNLSGSDRESNPVTMPANVLTSITYPTGGSSTFAYETNYYNTTEMVKTYRDSVSNSYKAPGSSTMNSSGFMDANGNITPTGKLTGKKLYIFCRVDRMGAAAFSDDLNVLVYRDGSFLRRIPTAFSSYNFVLDSSTVLESGRNYRVFFEPFSQTSFNNWEIHLQVYAKKVDSTITNVPKTRYAGGLRVQNISDYDPVSQKNNVRKYTYIDPRQDDIPIYLSPQGADHYDVGSSTYPNPQVNYFRYRYGQSVYPFSDGRDVAGFGYSNVEISEFSNGEINGLTEFSYNGNSNMNLNTIQYFSNSNGGLGISNPIMASVPFYPTGRGDLIQEKHYKVSGSIRIPVSMDYYYYDRENPQKIWQMVFTQGLGRFSDGFDRSRVFNIYASHFSIPIYRNVVYKKDHVEYDAIGNETLRSFEQYVYDKNNGHYQLIKKSSATSFGDTLNTHYRYPQDYPIQSVQATLDSTSAGIRLLQQKHVITPVETYKERINRDSPANKHYFDALINIFHKDQPLLKQVKVVEPNVPLTSFSFSNINNGVFSNESSYKNRLWLSYDSKNRIKQQSMELGAPVSFLWGSSLLQPAAQITNAKITDVFHENFEEYIGAGLSSKNDSKTGRYSRNGGYSINLSGLSNGIYVLSYWKKESNGLWTLTIADNIIVASSTYTISTPANLQVDDICFYPKNAQMVTYTFDKLVGMTSQTDAKGMTTYYEYDSFQRLKAIKDQGKNIIKNYDYNYKL